MKKMVFAGLVSCIVAGQIRAGDNDAGMADSETNIVICLERALKGDPRSEYLVGKAYMWGLGVEKNPAQAFCWASRAAEHENTDGINLLGVCYENGVGCARNGNKAVELYEKAAVRGSIKAKGNLGCMYALGWGKDEKEKQGTRDIGKATPLLKECLGSGLEHAPAMCALVCCYEQIGADKHEAEIFKWSQKAASLGNPWACRKLAECSLLGIGCTDSESDCLKWLKESMRLHGASICGVQLGMSKSEIERPSRQFRLFEKESLYETFESKAKVVWKVELHTDMAFRSLSDGAKDKEEQMVLDLLEKKYKNKFDTRSGGKHVMKCGMFEIEVTRGRWIDMYLYFKSEFLNSYVGTLNRLLKEKLQREDDKNSGAVLDATDGADVL